MKKIAILFTILLCLAPATPLAAAGDGVISGQVVNGSPDGDSTANLELSLEAYTANAAEPVVINVQADDDGNFSFRNLDTSSNIYYFVGAVYAGVQYYSEEIVFAEGQTGKTAQLEVYETTEDDSAISIYWSHTVLTIENGNLKVKESFYILNNDYYTYTGSREVLSGIRVTAVLPIPAEARDLQLGPEIGGNAIFTDSGLAYTLPLIPSLTPASYTYTLVDVDSDFAFSRQVGYDQYLYDVLVQGADGVESQQLTKGDQVEDGGKVYETLNGSSIPAGETIVIQLSGLPQDTSQQTVLWALGTLIVLGSVFALLLRRGGGEIRAGVPESEERQLLAEIARLDDDFENGLIDEESYRLQRGALKTRIIRMRHNVREE